MRKIKYVNLKSGDRATDRQTDGRNKAEMESKELKFYNSENNG